MGFRWSFGAEYCQSALNLTAMGRMPSPSTLTDASLQCPRGPSPSYSSPMLNPPQYATFPSIMAILRWFLLFFFGLSMRLSEEWNIA